MGHIVVYKNPDVWRGYTETRKLPGVQEIEVERGAMYAILE
jgi:hypothetical protein